MSKAHIEDMIPRAIEVLSKEFGHDGKIESVYQGYISSFGVGVVQVGLLPTLAYFESEKSNDTEDANTNGQKGDRKIISDLVRNTLNIKEDISLLKHAIDALNKEEFKEEFKEEIKDASVALKLSMRLFDLAKGGE